MAIFLICVVCCVWAADNVSWEEEHRFSDEMHDLWDKKRASRSKELELKNRVIDHLLAVPCNLLQVQVHLKLDPKFFKEVRDEVEDIVNKKLGALYRQARGQIAALGQPRIGMDCVYDQEGRLVIDQGIFLKFQKSAQSFMHIGVPYVSMSSVWPSSQGKFNLSAKEARGFFLPGYEWLWGVWGIEDSSLIGDSFKEIMCVATLRAIRSLYAEYNDAEEAQEKSENKACLQERIYYFLKDFGSYIDEAYIQKRLAEIEEDFWTWFEDFSPMGIENFWLLGEVNAEQKLHFKSKAKEPFKDPDISQVMETVKKLPWQEWKTCQEERVSVDRDFAIRSRVEGVWKRLLRADAHKFLCALRDLCAKHPGLNLDSVEKECSLSREDFSLDQYAEDRSLQSFMQASFDGQAQLAPKDIEPLLVLADRYRRSAQGCAEQRTRRR